jgi:hypothetical protein
MIDKVIPQRLNSDVDSKYRPSTDMIDALNIALKESYNLGTTNAQQNNFSGDSGVVKPIPSNASIEEITGIDSLISDNSLFRVIGSVADEVFNVIYFFAWSNDSDQMGVYAWDQDAILPGNNVRESYVKVYTSPKFNFPSDGFVKADVVYVGQRRNANESEDGGNVLLYFTDNKNEPRKLNVYDVMEASLNDYNDIDILDMITACPRTPLSPITFGFDFDPSRSSSNFTSIPGLQFAYQYVYRDNVESALSTYSKIAVPPAYLALGVVTSSVNLENRCVLSIPRGSREVSEIKILVRYGNLGLWRLIDEIKDLQTDSPDYDTLGDITYNFYNDRILIPITEEESNMPFSNLPRIAQAQTVSSDRLIYGNYVEQYPEVDVSADITAVYNGTPRQGDLIQISVVPVINQFRARPNDEDLESQEIYKKLGTNRVAGYKIDLSTVPSDYLESETIIQVDFTVIPDNHFHFYNQQNSYHGSREAGFFNGENNNDEILDRINDDGSQAPETDSDSDLYRSGKKYFGQNKGVKFIDGINDEARNLWNYQGWFPNPSPEGSIINNPSISGSTAVSYGTSAANPFIIKSEPLRFSVTFKTNFDTSDPKNFIKDTIYHFLTGEVDMPQISGQDFATEVQQTLSIASYDIDLDLSDGSKIYSQSGNDYRKHLIVGVQSNEGSPSDHTEEPVGYFIVNKANVSFGLKAFTYMEDAYDTEPNDVNCYIGLDLKALGNVEVYTCIPYVPVGTFISARANTDALPEEVYNGENKLWVGILPINLINGNIAYWITYSRETIASTDIESLPIYLPENQSWIPDNDVSENSIGWMQNDPRNMYFFGYTQYQYIIRQQNTVNSGYINPYENNVIDPILDWKLANLAAGFNNGRGSYCLGYLSAPSGNISENLKLINTSDEVFNYISSTAGLNSDLVNQNALFSLVDGEGGPGFENNKTGIGQEVSWGSISPYVLFKGDLRRRYIVDKNQLPTASLDELQNPAQYAGTSAGQSSPLLDLSDSEDLIGWVKSRGFLKSFRNTSIASPYESLGYHYMPDANADGDSTLLTYNHDVPSTLNTWVEVVSVTTFATGISGLYYPRSFKTNANHDFGIVYYDQRGRSGNVNYLGNVYVNGYSNAERGFDEKGRVDVLLSLNNDPPSWATQYQIVYSPNSTIGDFVQYTTGPAFVQSVVETDPLSNDESLIYVSLAHLQGVNNISYSHAFGAVNKDGGKDLYTHKQGDRLRILYYTDTDGEEVVYPKNYVFDIVDVVNLSSNPLENPLFQGEGEQQVGDLNYGGQAPTYKTGQFLVLKNNPDASGFTYGEVVASMQALDDDNNPTYDVGSNFWNNRTVVEIFSPKKVQEFDDRFYYEIGEKYDVARNSQGNPVHSQTSITLKDGDVWWRRVAVNFPDYVDGEGFQFLSTESVDGDIESLPSFKNVILETLAFTDLIPGCNGLDWGKPKVIVPGSKPLYKRSSLIYSDKNNYASKANRYTTFNATTLNFKDLPNEYGSINYILNDYDNVVVIQENKASSIPVSRNIISTATGEQSLIASQKILGTQKFYGGDYGSGGNPEGVIRAGEAIYFAHKGKREVYKLTRSKGVAVVSNNNMKAYFNNIFAQALKDERNGEGKVRVVSGYDPLRDEYIISVFNMEDFTGEEFEYDPLTGVFEGVTIIDGDVDTEQPGGDEGPVAPEGTDETEDTGDEGTDEGTGDEGPEEPTDDEGTGGNGDGGPADPTDDGGTGGNGGTDGGPTEPDDGTPTRDDSTVDSGITDVEPSEEDPTRSYLGLSVSSSGGFISAEETVK